MKKLAILASSGKIPCSRLLLLMALDNRLHKIWGATLTGLGAIQTMQEDN